VLYISVSAVQILVLNVNVFTRLLMSVTSFIQVPISSTAPVVSCYVYTGRMPAAIVLNLYTTFSAEVFRVNEDRYIVHWMSGSSGRISF